MATDGKTTRVTRASRASPRMRQSRGMRARRPARLSRQLCIYTGLAPFVGRLVLFDSWWALVLLYPTFTIPFCTWLMQGFLRTVPREVEEAAWIDGCSVLGGIVRVVLPLSVPGIATIAIFAFTLSMQEYLYAVVFAAPVDQKVVTVGLPTMLIRGDIYFWGS